MLDIKDAYVMTENGGRMKAGQVFGMVLLIEF